MNKIIIIILFSILKLNALNQNHIELGMPIKTGKFDLLVTRVVKDTLLYVVGYDTTLHVPSWVSWNLSKGWYGPADRFSGNFLTDTSLPTKVYRVKHSDYTNSGYDRGHMVRSEERTLSDEQNKATFFLTNILPQTAELNRQTWLSLEYYCEDLCKKQNKELFVIAGGLSYNSKINNLIGIPDTCYKIIVVLDSGQGLKDIKFDTQIIAVKMPNNVDVKNHNWTEYICTVDDIEASTGYDYLNLIPKQIQDLMERITFVPTGVETKKKEDDEKIYPNPANNIISTDYIGEFEIYDNLSNVVFKGNTFDGNINVVMLGNGIYFLKTKSIKKFVISK
ncbi:MAG: DNA/RNA non-specific endonuclease [Candidatus Kapabacteria bacterium]|nr:DNA/RNA non-specific endonuclease [Candidatus Kapabacteria bacterium]